MSKSRNSNRQILSYSEVQQPYHPSSFGYAQGGAAPLTHFSACRTGRLSWEAFGVFTCKLE
jgi:hypothetical protein